MRLSVSVAVIDRGALGGKPGGILQQKIGAFIKDVNAARTRSAATATQVSKQNVRRIRDLDVPTGGRDRYHGLQDALRWRPVSGGSGVGLALNELNAKFPIWLVHEIGTGERAVQRVAGQPNPVGRPGRGSSYIKTVKSQRGRAISNFYVFASRGGQYSPPGSARGQQLYARSMVKGAPVRYDPQTQRSAANIRITREIRGQHFVQKGGQAGFREYRESVLAAARSQLKKRRTV